MTVKLASADHKKLITTMLSQVYEDFAALKPDDAKFFVAQFGANNWFDLVKSSKWKRISKMNGGKSAAGQQVIRRFGCMTPHGEVEVIVTERIKTGESMPTKTTVQFDIYPAQLKAIVDYATGAVMGFSKGQDGLKMGGTNLTSKQTKNSFVPPPGESMLDTPKPGNFGAFA